MSKYSTPPTIRGYAFGEVASAFQKCVRRGLEEDALYWAIELDRSGYGAYVWKRMLIMTSEDVGLAEPSLPASMRALYDNWVEQRKRKDERHFPERLFLVHGVLLLVRAKKSRIVDHALIWAYSDHIPYRDIPDVALDKHTRRGKLMGRGFEHFFAEGIQLANADETLVDEYQERSGALLRGELGEPTNPPRSRGNTLFDMDDSPTGESRDW